MKRGTSIFIMMLVVGSIAITPSYAGTLAHVKSLVTGEVLALFISALFALVGGSLGLVFIKVSRTFKELGEFMTTLGTAIEDKRITRDELASIVHEGREIFGVWR